MAISILASSGALNFNSTNESVARPWGMNVSSAVTATVALEARVQGVVPASGTLRRFRVEISDNANATAQARVVLRLNGAHTVFDVLIPAGATGLFEVVADVAVTAGDLLSLGCRLLALGTTVVVRSVQVDYESTDGKARNVLGLNSPNNVSTNVSVADARYAPVFSYNNSTVGWKTTIGPNSATPMGASGSFVSATTFIRANTTNAATVFTLFKNGAATGMSITVPAATTGRFNSTGSPVAISPGDEFSWRREITGLSSGSIFQVSLDLNFESGDGSYDLFVGYIMADTTPTWTAAPVGALGYIGVGGFLQPSATSHGSVRIPEAGRLSRLRARGYAVNAPSDYPAFTTINGAQSGLDVTIPTGGDINSAAWISNTTDEESVAVGALVNVGCLAVAGGSLEERRTVFAAGFTITPGDASAEVTPPTGSLQIVGAAPQVILGLAVEPPAGLLRITGLAPTLTEFSGVTPVSGALVIEGIAPVIVSDLDLSPPTGELRIVGRAPGVFVGVALTPGLGELLIEGRAPVLFTVSGATASQLATLSLAAPDAPDSRASQVAALTLAEPPPPPMRASQAALLTIGEIVPDVLASQLAVLALGHGSACVTERCQIWKITRRDGRVFRYTSHDRPVRYGGQVYQSCRSLNPSASENASSLGSVGNIELTGIIDDDGISEADLYGGLFDDAFVTVDLITWGAGTETPRRLASGWTGALSQGETSFNMEVLGSGARLEQQALVQMVTPGCRWVFGSSECGVNAEALKVSGVVVSARTRGAFKATLSGGDGSSQWQNGRVRWTSGANLGQVTETKTVDFATGEIVLWASPGYIAAPGDTFDVLPGCDFARDGGCTVYANTINFGGFPDVPGSDAILETPLAQY